MENAPSVNFKTLWNQVVSSLRAVVSDEDFESWIEPMKTRPAPDGALEITVPNRLCASWIEENFLDDISTAWTEASGQRNTLRLVCDEQPAQGNLFADEPDKASQKVRKPPARRPGGFLARYDFDNFVVGPSNQFAHAAARAVAGQPGALYNPFFIFGGVGLGKTHLANAIGNAIVDSDPNARVLFLSTDSFTNQLIDAISRNRVQEFKNRVRRMDVLVVDDIQFLAGRERTQEEFFHVFNALYDSGKQIVLTSDKFPNEIQGVEERLCNRFGWGLVADIQSPDAETRVAILRRKAQAESISVPDEVMSYVASQIDSNVRDLEGALTRLSAYASLNRSELTLDLARELLATSGGNGQKEIGLEDIATGVNRHFGLRPGELAARRRTKKVAEARQVAMYIMRNHAGASFPRIGEFLGGRDHSTVVHACRVVEKKRSDDPRFRDLVDTVTRMIGCG
ncbi:MAG: chromosomal replication initiator protein DnaA [bacterium]